LPAHCPIIVSHNHHFAIIIRNRCFAVDVAQSVLSHAKVPGGVGNWGTRNSESERMTVRILGNYHRVGPYGGITGYHPAWKFEMAGAVFCIA